MSDSYLNTDGTREQDNSVPPVLSSPARLLGKVLVGKGKRGNKEEYAYITDRDGVPRRFASRAELRRAAFMQFGDDLNIEVEGA
jgi:hypothetical protein